MPTLAEEARRRGYNVERAGRDYVITDPATGRSIRAWENVQYVPRLNQLATLAAPEPRTYPAPAPALRYPTPPAPPTPAAAGAFYRGLPGGFQQTLSELTGLPQQEFAGRFQEHVGRLRAEHELSRRLPLAGTWPAHPALSTYSRRTMPWTTPAAPTPWTPPTTGPGWWNAQPQPQAPALSPAAFAQYVRNPNFRAAIDFLVGPTPIW